MSLFPAYGAKNKSSKKKSSSGKQNANRNSSARGEENNNATGASTSSGIVSGSGGVRRSNNRNMNRYGGGSGSDSDSDSDGGEKRAASNKKNQANGKSIGKKRDESPANSTSNSGYSLRSRNAAEQSKKNDSSSKKKDANKNQLAQQSSTPPVGDDRTDSSISDVSGSVTPRRPNDDIVASMHHAIRTVLRQPDNRMPLAQIREASLIAAASRKAESESQTNKPTGLKSILHKPGTPWPCKMRTFPTSTVTSSSVTEQLRNNDAVSNRNNENRSILLDTDNNLSVATTSSATQPSQNNEALPKKNLIRSIYHEPSSSELPGILHSEPSNAVTSSSTTTTKNNIDIKSILQKPKTDASTGRKPPTSTDISSSAALHWQINEALSNRNNELRSILHRSGNDVPAAEPRAASSSTVKRSISPLVPKKQGSIIYKEITYNKEKCPSSTNTPPAYTDGMQRQIFQVLANRNNDVPSILHQPANSASPGKDRTAPSSTATSDDSDELVPIDNTNNIARIPLKRKTPFIPTISSCVISPRGPGLRIQSTVSYDKELETKRKRMTHLNHNALLIDVRPVTPPHPPLFAPFFPNSKRKPIAPPPCTNTDSENDTDSSDLMSVSNIDQSSPPRNGDSNDDDTDDEVYTYGWMKNESYKMNRHNLVMANGHKPNQKSGKEAENIEDGPSTSRAAQSNAALKEDLKFTGKENYDIDTVPRGHYLTVSTLHKPVRPRYKLAFERAQDNFLAPNQRYFKQNLQDPEKAEISELKRNKLLARSAELYKIFNSTNEILTAKEFIELYEINNMNLTRMTPLSLALKQLSLLEAAMQCHRFDEHLIQFYVDVNVKYMSNSEAKLRMKGMIAKDPWNFKMLMAYIVYSQSTMAHCTVPKIIDLYSNCMDKLTKLVEKPNQSQNEVNRDLIMLRLFHNGALFLRQAGSIEKFFTLIKLALEIRSNIDLNDFYANAEEEKKLLEYEEVILKSGLPMNEIWLRIEKLRQSYQFRPYRPTHKYMPGTNADPGRFVETSEVCNLLYPLHSNAYRMDMILIIARLMKVPFICSEMFAKRMHYNIGILGELDDIEMALATVGERSSYVLPLGRENKFLLAVRDMIRTLAVLPTYLNYSIGYEIFDRCVKELLRNAAKSYKPGEGDNERVALMILLFRYQRTCMVMDKLTARLTEPYKTERREYLSQFLEENPACTAFYTEFALWQYEVLFIIEPLDTVMEVFDKIIDINKRFKSDHSELFLANAYVTYAEVLFSRKMKTEALRLLISLGLKEYCDKDKVHTPEEADKAEKNLHCLLQKEILGAINHKLTHLELYEYIFPHVLLVLLRARMLLLILTEKHTIAWDYMKEILSCEFAADAKTERLLFYREKIYEYYTIFVQIPIDKVLPKYDQVIKITKEAFHLYPTNLYILQRWCLLKAVPWYRIRTGVLTHKVNIVSLIYLIAAIHTRYLNRSAIFSYNTLDQTLGLTGQFDIQEPVRNRVISIFDNVVPNMLPVDRRTKLDMDCYDAWKHNSLFWRIYIRCLSNVKTPFDRTNKCLVTALDAVPWCKALYIDGIVFVPQETVRLQDTLLEKKIRTYSWYEELQVLREIYSTRDFIN